MKLTITFRLLILVAIGLLLACNNKPKDKSDKENFEEILNDPRVNSKEVGECEGIKYFQVEKNGKTGFRDLDGKIVIEPIYDMAEMFSEGYSAVTVGEKHGFIDETGKYVLPLQSYEFLGSLNNGLADFRINDKVGFINIKGEVIIKPQFDWADEFSEGLCVVRNDNGKLGSGKSGYIDTTGKLVMDFKFKYAGKFENGKAKVQLDKDFVYIDKTGNIISDTNRTK
jgi:WG containing repeat